MIFGAAFTELSSVRKRVSSLFSPRILLLLPEENIVALAVIQDAARLHSSGGAFASFCDYF